MAEDRNSRITTSPLNKNFKSFKALFHMLFHLILPLKDGITSEGIENNDVSIPTFSKSQSHLSAHQRVFPIGVLSVWLGNTCMRVLLLPTFLHFKFCSLHSQAPTRNLFGFTLH